VLISCSKSCGTQAQLTGGPRGLPGSGRPRSARTEENAKLLLQKFPQSATGFVLPTVLRDDVPTRGNRYKIVQEHCANNYRKNFFVQRVAPLWNSIPPSIVDFSSFTRFKLSLKNVNLSIFTRFGERELFV